MISSKQLWKSVGNTLSILETSFGKRTLDICINLTRQDNGKKIFPRYD